MPNFNTPTMFLDASIDLATVTMRGGLGRDSWAQSFEHFTQPDVLEEALTPEMVALYAERQFGGWQDRKATNSEQAHEDAQAKYDKLPQSVRDFIKSINTAKLASHAAYITQEGLRALIEVGNRGGSISEISHLTGPETYPSLTVKNADAKDVILSPIHVAMLEIHHDVWLNINAQNKREHIFALENHELRSRSFWNVPVEDFSFGGQTHSFPFGIGMHSYNADSVQVDKDAVTFALMPEHFQEALIALAQPGDGHQFFRPDASLAVRDLRLPVLSPLLGLQFSRRATPEGIGQLLTVIDERSKVGEWYTSASVLDALRIENSDRALIKALLYGEDGKLLDGDHRHKVATALSTVVERLTVEKRVFERVDPRELLRLIEEELTNH